MTLYRRWQLLKLKMRAYVLQAEVDNAEALLSDHAMRHRNALRDLQQCRRRIIAMEDADILLKRIA